MLFSAKRQLFPHGVFDVVDFQRLVMFEDILGKLIFSQTKLQAPFNDRNSIKEHKFIFNFFSGPLVIVIYNIYFSKHTLEFTR